MSLYEEQQDQSASQSTGSLIRSFRDRRGWTQLELAQRMGAAPREVLSLVRAIQRWEAGAEPKRSALRRVAGAFGVPVSALLSVEDDDPTVDLTVELRAQLAAAQEEIGRVARVLASMRVSR